MPPKVRIAYPALNSSGQQVIRIFSITLRSTNGYSELQGQVELEGSIVPGVGSHLVFPQLIPVDGVAGSDGRLDTPVMLRYAVLSGDNVDERATPLYSGLRGDSVFLGESSVSAMFPGGCAPQGCFLGHYRYGAFFEKDGTTLRYFTPWSGEADGIAGIHAVGATVDVVPN